MKISGKHIIEEINGIRCSVAEKECFEQRAGFLRAVLEHNGYEVRVQKNIPLPPKGKTPEVSVPETFKVGVTDLSFVVSVMAFSRRLKTLENKILLPAYWNQEDMSYDGWYWKYK